jgi:hypothetical protein
MLGGPSGGPDETSAKALVPAYEMATATPLTRPNVA